jgi:adenosylmethionine-8-amino-7-oxononanoate aminotransferase
VELVDPRDGESFLPVDLDVASLVDDTALGFGLLVTSTHPQADGYAGDQTLLAPAYVSTDEELAELVDRSRATMGSVERSIKGSLPAVGAG